MSNDKPGKKGKEKTGKRTVNKSFFEKYKKKGSEDPDEPGQKKGSRSGSGTSGRSKSRPGPGSGNESRPGSSRGRKPDSGPGRKKRPSKTYAKKARQSDSSPSEASKTKQAPYLKDEIRLNKYIAHSGFCSRREADEYISAGKVKVNGKVASELGMKVTRHDRVQVDGQNLSLEPFVYILLNKGKDTISTTDDEKDRNTVLDAVEDATGYRVYPVGRLDRNTMGLLLLTNDGDLAHRLMHPSYKVKKTYEATATRILSDEELLEMKSGIVLEDGPVKPASVKRDMNNPDTIEISVFEGRNHLIRRMISHFGAEVVRLKRVRYAGLTDKDIRVGRWRYLRQKEINDLRKLVKLETLDFNKDEA
jgi:23S rRNA pseudouridine2605 synthase